MRVLDTFCYMCEVKVSDEESDDAEQVWKFCPDTTMSQKEVLDWWDEVTISLCLESKCTVAQCVLAGFTLKECRQGGYSIHDVAGQ